MNDVILTHDHDPSRCGTVKFSQQLAQKLGIPCVPIDRRPFSAPLLSIQPLTHLGEWFEVASWYGTYDLFLHSTLSPSDRKGLEAARRVIAANAEIAEACRRLGRGDVIEGWCPATIMGKPTRGRLNILTYGMAHKVQMVRYQELKKTLDAEGADYSLSLSLGVHDGTTLEQADVVVADMRVLFGTRFRYLGYLSDDALSKEIQDCDRVALFYEPAVRANNTTVWAAVSAGKQVYTNTDEFSPELDATKYSWVNLLEILRA